MKRPALLPGLIFSSLLLSGCFSLTDKDVRLPAAPSAHQTQQLVEQKKQNLQDRKPQFTLPETLGGIVSSDSWIVYQTKQEEEFKGHVSYDNGQYIFKSDYALSQRKKNLITAKGNVFIRHNESPDIWYELHADRVQYNYQTGQGSAHADKNKRIELKYHTDKNELITAYARQAHFNTKEKTYDLDGQAHILYTNEKGQNISLKADRIIARQQDRYALLEGHAEADNGQYRLQSDKMEYDGLAGQAKAYGDRPLATGATEMGTFAIIADEVSAQTDSRHMELKGQVQGWIVSDTINQSAAAKSL